MTISRGVGAESKWAEGVFDLQWRGALSPTRGYFSTKTECVWIKTPRFVEGRSTSVKYCGTLRVKPEDVVLWEGLASTDGQRLSWSFLAQRLSQ